MEDNKNQMMYTSPIMPECIKMVQQIDNDGMMDTNCFVAEQHPYRDAVQFIIPQIHSLYNGSKFDQFPSQLLTPEISMFSTPMTSQMSTTYQNPYMISPPFAPDHKNLPEAHEDPPSYNYIPSIQSNSGVGKHMRSDKSNKGLRHFSMKVLQKVQEKKVTTYNEVADDLVREFGNTSADPEKQNYEQKNIRRRVYDALNVLMAMNIIHKEKKDIRWVGLPSTNAQEYQRLNEERNKIGQQIEEKIKKLRDLILQTVCVQQLLTHNKEKGLENENIPEKNKLDLPFAAVITPNTNSVDCAVSESRSELTLEFRSNFDVVDETQLLRHMGFSGGLETGTCSVEELNLFRSYSPETLHPFIDVLGTFSPHESIQLILNLRNTLIDEKIHSQDVTVSQANFFTKLIESCVQRRNGGSFEEMLGPLRTIPKQENGSTSQLPNIDSSL